MSPANSTGTAPASLADRIRAILPGSPPPREVRMFGGRSFMVNDRIAVCAQRDGSLLVRVPPEQHAELIARPGAEPARMGAGRVMGPGWIRVSEQAITSDGRLSPWIDLALEYNARVAGAAR